MISILNSIWELLYAFIICETFMMQILLDGPGILKFADFGLSRVEGENLDEVFEQFTDAGLLSLHLLSFKANCMFTMFAITCAVVLQSLVFHAVQVSSGKTKVNDQALAKYRRNTRQSVVQFYNLPFR